MYRKLTDRRKRIWAAALCAALMLAWSPLAFAEAGKHEKNRAKLEADATAAIEALKDSDLPLRKYFDNAVAFTVFPDVGKVAVGVGGARGHGVIYERRVNEEGIDIVNAEGKIQWDITGYAKMTQATLGVQLGAKKYYEIIFFENESALRVFKEGNTELSAQASAVAGASGASATADYYEGVAVFTKPRSGLIFEISVGGQKFSYHPKWDDTADDNVTVN